ncbi:unnamed protein product [Vitrella brassicaformis CCMP3155]|uniref:SAP domain-containing protein n=1 Tax=Vitrella brassicaformis (strain CCMP3155) TaxID=1169540 RepID=A0A0G4EKQ2_VITBC|nr:unnamed protein product [Vitrella brassicaformis CCMP3155]|mmetsp:Transcript_23495/g.58034  ORF Transcript_23495/g.58034 Transcript_23495/m.58034 type:complete len:363 (-) Transcript_23495:460-1548(-)|eukprot:CEL97019.1 unnamed protein product [Vitrella brassicaformis CCMP3155]
MAELHADREALSKLTIADLKLHLRDYGLPSGGNKTDLIDRLYDAIRQGHKKHSPKPERRSARLQGKEPVDASKQQFRGFLQNLLIIILLAVLYCVAFYFVFTKVSDVPAADRQKLYNAALDLGNERLTKWQRVMNLKLAAEQFATTHPLWVVSLMTGAYIFFQTFAVLTLWIPGTTTAITVVAGALFGWWPALALCCVLSTVGPMCAYGLFYFVGRPVALYLGSGKIEKFKKHVHEVRDGHMMAVMFGRVLPVFPNFLVSMAAPIVGIGILPFTLGTFIGLIPNNMMWVTVGLSLKNLDPSAGLKLPASQMVLLCVIAMCVPLPYLIRRQYETKTGLFKKKKRHGGAVAPTKGGTAEPEAEE